MPRREGGVDITAQWQVDDTDEPCRRGSLAMAFKPAR